MIVELNKDEIWLILGALSFLEGESMVEPGERELLRRLEWRLEREIGGEGADEAARRYLTEVIFAESPNPRRFNYVELSVDGFEAYDAAGNLVLAGGLEVYQYILKRRFNHEN